MRCWYFAFINGGLGHLSVEESWMKSLKDLSNGSSCSATLLAFGGFLILFTFCLNQLLNVQWIKR